jgi:hypothetical protein
MTMEREKDEGKNNEMIIGKEMKNKILRKEKKCLSKKNIEEEIGNDKIKTVMVKKKKRGLKQL